MFKTSSNLPFLHFVHNADKSLTLRADNFLADRSLTQFPTQLYREVDMSRVKRSDRYFGAFVVNILANDIARASRRGVGNILFVPNYDKQLYYQHCGTSRKFQIEIDRSLAPNEVRCAYWRLHLNSLGQEMAVDGGIQFTPDGGVLAPNASAYFVRCFV